MLQPPLESAPRLARVGGAHPRSRGENSVPAVARAAHRGSSPLTRGKRARRPHKACFCGLIPAHAGKTRRMCLTSESKPAHPRSRGENRDGVLKSMSIGGSSPLTRGKRHFQPLNNLMLRLIPAHAGKTSLWPSTRSALRAHPRSRGENACPNFGTFLRCGSSPLTRGKPRPGTAWLSGAGLIPAHAGKTRPAGSFPR